MTLVTPKFWKPDEFPPFQIPSTRFLVDPIIPRGGIVLLHGPRAAGKTQIAFELARAIAEGKPFLETFATEKGKVLYIEFDMPIAEFQERLNRAVPTFPALREVAFVTHDNGVDILAPLAAPDPLFQALQEARSWSPDLVIVDTLRKSHKEDENSADTPSKVYGRWKSLLPGATWCFLHHDRKLPFEMPLNDVSHENFRGSSAWLDDADTGLHLTRDRKAGADAGHRAVLSWSKLRTCGDLPPLKLELDEEASLLPKLILDPQDHELRFRQFQLAQENVGVSVSRADARNWLKKAGVPDRTLQRYLSKLYGDGGAGGRPKTGQ